MNVMSRWERDVETWLDRQKPERVQQREEDERNALAVIDNRLTRNVISLAICAGELGPNADVWAVGNDNWLEWRFGR